MLVLSINVLTVKNLPFFLISTHLIAFYSLCLKAPGNESISSIQMFFCLILINAKPKMGSLPFFTYKPLIHRLRHD